jgi:hypothetical protein
VALDGFALVQDYEQQRGGGAWMPFMEGTYVRQ